MRSIERYLLAWIIGALALGSVLVALVTYLAVLEEMGEAFDAQLKNVAEAIVSYRSGQQSDGDTPVAAPAAPARNDEYEIVTQGWTLDGRRLFASDPRVTLPFTRTEGLARPRVQGEEWVAYTRVGAGAVVQAAQRVASRASMAADSAATVLLPMLVLIVAIGAFLVIGLRRGFMPLARAAQDVAARSATSLQAISTVDVPREITPLVASINGLLERLSAAFSAQRRFLADAAHELRTPVTALRLQLQWLQRSGDDSARHEAMNELASGIDRSQRLIEQLLQVARFEPDGETTARERVDLGELARAVVARMSAKAEQQGIDLGAAATVGSAVVVGDANQLTVLLNNLVENALRYTPAGGVVDVVASVDDGQPTLRVVDNGPGVPEAERQRVFDRFYRGADAHSLARDAGGSGLGLAIVGAIAGRHGAVASLHDTASGQGLEVRVVFAMAPPP